MSNSPNSIINKSISELKKRKNRLENEINKIDNIIISISELLIDTNTKPKFKKRRRYSQRITEQSVRDAILRIAANPPDESGYFRISHIIKQLGIHSTPPSLKNILDRYIEKNILETKKYRNGKQYRYIRPNSITQEDHLKDIKSSLNKINNSISQPVPGTGDRINVRDKDIEKLLKIAKSQGFVISRTGSGHIKVSTPNLKKYIQCSGTSNKRYLVTKLESDLKKIGVKLGE